VARPFFVSVRAKIAKTPRTPREGEAKQLFSLFFSFLGVLGAKSDRQRVRTGGAWPGDFIPSYALLCVCLGALCVLCGSNSSSRCLRAFAPSRLVQFEKEE
jgi:hypothetical protein